MITELIRYSLPEDKVSDFLQSYRAADAYLARSPDCLGYEILQGAEEPTRFTIILRWVSKERHLEGFRKSEMWPVCFSAMKPFFDFIEEMMYYQTLEASEPPPVSDSV